MVLTLIIVTDEGAQYDAVRAASAAGRQHPCRILVVIIRRPEQRSRLDAEIRVGETSPGETVLLRMYGPLGQHADSVVVPLLLPDTPVVTWWPDVVPPIPAHDPMGALAQRRITDTAAAGSPRDALAMLAAGYRPGRHRPGLDPGDAVAVAAGRHAGPAVRGGHRRHGQRRGGQPDRRPDRGLAVHAYGVEIACEPSAGPGITEVSFTTGDGEIVITRPDGRVAHLRRPGQPERRVALHRRETPELLAEELRRLDPDEVYAETLDAVPYGPLVPARRPRRDPGVHHDERAEVIVHRDAGPAGQGGRRPAGHQAGRRPGRGRGAASLVLTGGGIGTAVLAELAAAPARDAVDWRHLDIWWGDERFLPAGDPERNETGARGRCCATSSTWTRTGCTRCPARTARTATTPRPRRPGTPASCAPPPARRITGRSPTFDVLMLGIGPEGHVASLFPAMPALYDDRSVVAVHGAPKPPPVRLTLTLPAIRSGAGGVDHRLGPGQGRGGPAGAVRTPARCRCPRRARAAGSRPCSCSTARGRGQGAAPAQPRTGRRPAGRRRPAPVLRRIPARIPWPAKITPWPPSRLAGGRSHLVVCGDDSLDVAGGRGAHRHGTASRSR